MKHVLFLIALALGVATPTVGNGAVCQTVAMANAAESSWEAIALKPAHLREWVESLPGDNQETKFLSRMAALNGILSTFSTPLLLVPPGFEGIVSPVPSIPNVTLITFPFVGRANQIDVRKAWVEHYRNKKGEVDFEKLWQWLLPQIDSAREAKQVSIGFNWVLFETDPHAHIESQVAYDIRLHVNQSPSSPTLVEHTHFDWKGTKLGYLAIKQFTGNSVPRYVATALDEIRKSGARGLILDLRDNTGGQTFNAIQIGGYLMGKNKPMMYQEDIVTRQPFPSPMKSNAAQRIDVPIIVLVNGLSASASEVLAGSLQYYGHAYLLGEPTYGKGTVLQPEHQKLATTGPLAGLPIYVTKTTSIYFLPSMKSPQIYGLPIDFPYEQPGAKQWLREAEVPTAFENAQGPIELKPDARRNHLHKLFSQIEKPSEDEKDPQLFAAVELFHLWLQ